MRRLLASVEGPIANIPLFYLTMNLLQEQIARCVQNVTVVMCQPDVMLSLSFAILQLRVQCQNSTSLRYTSLQSLLQHIKHAAIRMIHQKVKTSNILTAAFFIVLQSLSSRK